MQRNTILFAFVAVVLISCARTSAQSTDDAPRTRREARHDLFVQTASELKILSATSDVELKLRGQSVLRYTNPVRGRFNDAETFVFTTRQKVPHVVLSTSLRGTGKLMLEAVSVSPNPLVSELPGFGEWVPEQGGSGRIESALQPPASGSSARQLLIMRRIAESVTFRFKKREWNEARLLSQPLYRYSASESGITDGAIFGYSESNDPEALLHVWREVTDDNSVGTWYWLAASSTSLPLKLESDGETVWEKPGYWNSPRPPESSYVETFVHNHPDLVDLPAAAEPDN